MVIRNRDGSVYKLHSTPNQLMLNQEFWNGNYQLHNLKFEKKVILSSNEIIEKPKQEKTFMQELEETKKEEVKITMSCLPTKEETDMYGQTRYKYEEPFSFESVLIQEEDLFIIFWTNVKKLTKNSIVYPKKDTKRWWKIDKIEEKSDGFLYKAYPSDFTPSF